MTAISVAFDRTTLSLSTLTVTNTPGGTYWIPSEGTEWPKFARRKTRAPASPYLSGPGVLLAKVADGGTLPLTVYASGATTAALETAKDALQAAVDQWSYTLTLTIDGTARAFIAECSDEEITWGEINPGMVRAKIARGSLVVPLIARS